MGAVAQSKEPKNHIKEKYVERKYHLIRDIVQRGDVIVMKIATIDNLADPFTKVLPQKVFERHLDSLGLKCNSNELWVQVGVCWGCALKLLFYAWDIDILYAYQLLHFIMYVS